MPGKTNYLNQRHGWTCQFMCLHICVARCKEKQCVVLQAVCSAPPGCCLSAQFLQHSEAARWRHEAAAWSCAIQTYRVLQSDSSEPSESKWASPGAVRSKAVPEASGRFTSISAPVANLNRTSPPARGPVGPVGPGA